MADHTIDYLPLDELQPDPANPKDHDEATIGGSLNRFGYVEPMVRDDRTGYLVSGHGRHKVLTDHQRAGKTPPKGVKLADDGSWLVPVVTGWASADDAEAHAALVALNRTSELGGWVDSALYTILDELDHTADLDGIGFAHDDLEVMRRKLDAEAVWGDTTEGDDAKGMADEFEGITGDPEQDYQYAYAATITVRFRDVDAVRDFMHRTGLRGLPTQGRNQKATVHYPPGWKPSDNDDD